MMCRGIAALALPAALLAAAAGGRERAAEPGIPRQAALPCVRLHELGRGVFLIANRDLRDPNFSHTVVLLLDHGDGGAMGLIVNRPTELPLGAVLPGLDEQQAPDGVVFSGGPVAPGNFYMLVRAAPELEGAFRIFSDVHFSRSPALLERLAHTDEVDSRFRIYAGYAGWSPGQLEMEVERGDWLVRPGDGDAVFHDDPVQLWKSLVPADPMGRVRLERRGDSRGRTAGMPAALAAAVLHRAVP
jgi:putative transcriptional regulator